MIEFAKNILLNQFQFELNFSGWIEKRMERVDGVSESEFPVTRAMKSPPLRTKTGF
jgi:hypothetical protein